MGYRGKVLTGVVVICGAFWWGMSYPLALVATWITNFLHSIQIFN